MKKVVRENNYDPIGTGCCLVGTREINAQIAEYLESRQIEDEMK